MQDELRRLVDEAWAVEPRGWDLTALAGRTVAQPLPWDYVALARDVARRATRALDVDTGGGEVLAEVRPPPGSLAIEPHPPNVPVAAARLRPLGVEVRVRTGPRLPVDDGSADLVLNRHGHLDLGETVRVLRPGGRLLTQQVGAANDLELNAALEIPYAPGEAPTSADALTVAATAAGLVVERVQEARPTTVYADVGAVVLQLRMVPWQAPGFDPERHLAQLYRLDEQIRERGGFTVTSHRLLLVASRP
jgi:SAM-dependent methyltransferase